MDLWISFAYYTGNETKVGDLPQPKKIQIKNAKIIEKKNNSKICNYKHIINSSLLVKKK